MAGARAQPSYGSSSFPIGPYGPRSRPRDGWVLSGDLRPGCLPVHERDAVALAVPALRERGLPEFDRLEVGVRIVGVQRGARPLLDLVHQSARVRVGRGLSVVDG